MHKSSGSKPNSNWLPKIQAKLILCRARRRALLHRAMSRSKSVGRVSRFVLKSSWRGRLARPLAPSATPHLNEVPAEGTKRRGTGYLSQSVHLELHHAEIVCNCRSILRGVRGISYLSLAFERVLKPKTPTSSTNANRFSGSTVVCCVPGLLYPISISIWRASDCVRR